MRKLYYVVGSANLPCRSGKVELMSCVCNDKKTAETLLSRLRKEYRDYVLWVGWQWRDRSGVAEVQKLPMHTDLYAQSNA